MFGTRNGAAWLGGASVCLARGLVLAAAVLLAEMGELEAFGRLERGPRAVGSAQMGQELQGNWPEMDVVQYDDAWMHSKTNQQHLI